jgi:hypothetical protein
VLGGVVFLSVLYIAIQRILQLLSFLFRSTEFKEPEIVVLRHELASCDARSVSRTSSPQTDCS